MISAPLESGTFDPLVFSCWLAESGSRQGSLVFRLIWRGACGLDSNN